MIRTEIAAGGSGGSAQALYASRPPKLGSVQHGAYCQPAYQLFFNSPSPLLSCARPQCPGTARLGSGAWYCWEPVSHTEENWDGFRLDLRAFPQVLTAWQHDAGCLFLGCSRGNDNVTITTRSTHTPSLIPMLSLSLGQSMKIIESMKTAVVWSGFLFFF